MGNFSSGMEYPTLITLGAHFFLPESDYSLEDVLFHEFLHQYFYGLVASNEVEDAWLDEGYTSYFSDKMMAAHHSNTSEYGKLRASSLLPGSGSQPILANLYLPVPPLEDFLGLKAADPALRNRAYFLSAKDLDPLLMPSWRWRNYAFNAYTKSNLVLATLERELGADSMARVMSTYVQRYAYRHPGAADFKAVAEEVAAQKLDWFFEPMWQGEGELDYYVRRPGSEPAEFEGYQLEAGGPVFHSAEGNFTADNPEKRMWRNRVDVFKKGSRVYPVDVLIRLTDGSEIRERWPGDRSWKRYVFYSDAKVERVVLDPDNKILLDANRFNNSYIVEPGTAASDKYKARLLVLAQNLIQSLVGGF